MLEGSKEELQQVGAFRGLEGGQVVGDLAHPTIALPSLLPHPHLPQHDPVVGGWLEGLELRGGTIYMYDWLNGCLRISPSNLSTSLAFLLEIIKTIQ